jgi:PAS domain S-box-containing protein
LAAIIDHTLALSTERDSRRLLESACRAARDIVGARIAVLGIVDNKTHVTQERFAAGADPATALGLLPPAMGEQSLEQLCVERHCCRLPSAPGERPLTERASPVQRDLAILGVPLVSPMRVYGWICLIDKLGAQQFSDEDERLAGILAAQVGRIYESGLLSEEVHRHARDLEPAVAEHKGAEEAQRANEEMFRSAFEHTNVAMVLTDLNHRFIRVNAAFARLFGYSPQEMLQLSMADITHPAHLEQSYERREVLLAGDSPFFEMEKRYLHKDGHVLWGLTNVALVRDSCGHPLLYVGQVQDITEGKRAQETLAKYTERLRILREMDRAFLAGEGPAAIAAAVLGPLRQLLGVPRAVVNLFDLANGEVEWLAAAGRRRVHVGPGVRYSIRLMGDVEALRRGELQLIDVHQLPHGAEVDALLASGIHAYVVVPMIAGGELIGALSFGGASAPLSTEQLSIAQETATQFAMVITQARLHERLNGQAEQLQVHVTERQQAEEALGRAQARLGHVLASSPAVIFTLGGGVEDLRLTWISENVRDMMGYTVEEVLQANWWHERVHPDDLQRVSAEIQNHLFARGRVADEYRFRHRDGTYRWVRSEIRLLRDAAGTPVDIVGSWSEITERKQLEDQYRQAQKMEAVGRLAGGVAHDFNNLLTIINGYSEVVLERLRPDDPLKGILEQIKHAGERAAGLTRQLLAFSRKQILVPLSVDLNGLLADLTKMLGRLIGEDIDLQFAPVKGLWRIRADPGQIEQVVINLAVNARDAMPQGGKLTIETHNVELDEAYVAVHAESRPGRYVLLAVTDTGCGMTPAVRARAFEPFFSTKGEKGTGLGLATVYGIVKQSGGQIEVYTEPGHGSTFKVYLPEDREGPAPSQSHPGIRPAPGGTETILLAEDEDGVRGLTRTVLHNNGYCVLEARNGGEALLVCEQHQGPIHLLVTDVVMPHMSGPQLAERLQQLRPGIKVLYLSGYTDDAMVHHGVLAPGTHFLQKPFSPPTLARKVREVLDQ